jgi:hypothetical protein
VGDGRRKSRMNRRIGQDLDVLERSVERMGEEVEGIWERTRSGNSVFKNRAGYHLESQRSR